MLENIKKFKIEKWALVIVIKDENGNIVEELSEPNPGGFPYWNENTVKRAEARVLELEAKIDYSELRKEKMVIANEFADMILEAVEDENVFTYQMLKNIMRRSRSLLKSDF